MWIGVIAVCIAVTRVLCAVPNSDKPQDYISEEELRNRVAEATKGFQDLTMVGTVVYKNRKALAKIESAYSMLYDFKCAGIFFKYPDKLRMEGKLGMVSFEYIVNGSTKIVRAPSVRINKKKDYSDDPAKTQDALDIGLITPSLWQRRKVELVNDPDATANGELKLRLRWPKGDTIHHVWIDAQDLYLKRFEKRDAQGRLQIKVVYSDPKRFDGVIWVPTRVEVFGPDGEKAGVSEVSDVKVNIGLPDSLFE
jgi:outer membrane lipoprotein-sorting protein